MDPDERLMALKKAYADIILNTAKEAAERILVSERKAQRFENELKMAKEEALRMLLRLKHMMEAKISEAELTSLSQQKKIEELEAQLQEAEDIVRDLREELRDVQSELERVKNNKVQHLSDRDIAVQGQITEMNRLHTSQFVDVQPPQSEAESIVACAMKHASQDYWNATLKCYCTSSHMRNSYSGSPDLPSIILRSKEPALYRNGCTHRIHACDRILLDQELSLSGKINKREDKKSMREDESGKVTRKVHRRKDEKKGNFVKKKFQADSLLPKWSLIKKRKRATRSKKSRSPLSRSIFGQSVQAVKVPEISLFRTDPIPVRDSAPSGENPSSLRLLSYKDDSSLELGCAGTSINKSLIKSCTDQIMKNTDKLTGKAALLNLGCRESPEIPTSETNHGKISPPSIKLESEASETSDSLPSRTINDRMFKYTFQRKRKRESLVRPDESEFFRNNASAENASLEKNTSHENPSVEKCTSDKSTSLENSNSMGNVSVEKTNSIDTKSFFVTESSQDNQQLVQVAHQLISLSDKKWWQ